MSITRALMGYGNSPSKVLSSAILCTLSFFYVFSFGSFIRANIFVLQNGITYDTFFQFFVINKSIDHIIISICLVSWLSICLVGRLKLFMFSIFAALVILGIALNTTLLAFNTILDFVALSSLPVLIVLSIYNKFAPRKILNNHFDLFLGYLGIISAAIGIFTVIISVIRLLYIHQPSTAVHDYAYNIFVLFSSLSPVLMVLLLFCIPFKVLATGLMRRLSTYQETLGTSLLGSDLRKRTISISILLIMLLSVLLAVVPHLPVVNNNRQLVGSDSSDYINWQNMLAQSKSLQDIMHEAFVKISAGDRPIALILIFGLVKTVPIDPAIIIDSLPIILAPALVLVVYLLTRELSSNNRLSILAALFTAVSFQTLIGAYAGYYANWIALIIGYLGFVLLFKFLKKAKKRDFVLFAISIILMLFCHEYTWTVIAIVMGVFLVVMLVTARYKRTNTVLLLLIVLSTVIIDVGKTRLVGVTNGFGRDLSVAHQEQVGVGQFANRWNNLKDTMQNYYGAQFSNFIILSLALYWVLRCSSRDVESIFFMIFFSIGIIPLLFGDWIIQSRVFYDIPFQIPAALSLSYVRKPDHRFMVLVPICIWLVAISLRNVSNFTFPS